MGERDYERGRDLHMVFGEGISHFKVYRRILNGEEAWLRVVLNQQWETLEGVVVPRQVQPRRQFLHHQLKLTCCASNLFIRFYSMPCFYLLCIFTIRIKRNQPKYTIKDQFINECLKSVCSVISTFNTQLRAGKNQ